MTRRAKLLALIVVGLALYAAGHRLNTMPRGAVDGGRPPRLSPDYAGVTIPPNIAPLNFRVAEPGRRYYARLAGAKGRPIALRGRGDQIRIPLRAWRALLAANRGGELTFEVSVRDSAGRWTRFAPVRNTVANEPIDPYLVYRWFQPTYSSNTPLGIYQRDLTTFTQTPIFRSPSSGKRCVNCHAFADGNPQRFSFQVRGRGTEASMMMVDGKRARTIDTRTEPKQSPAAVTTWHPGGRWVISSRNWIRQYFHQAGSPGRDALDSKSSLALIDSRNDHVTQPPTLIVPETRPAVPCWSPDGKWLYYSRLKRFWPASVTMPVLQEKQIHYDLVRAPFDAERGEFGPAELVLAAAEVKRSILEPRVSPDGRWLVVCLAGYGGFPIFRVPADLGLIDLSQRPWRAVSLNPQPETTLRETWHSWSRNSRWLVNSRKTDNGLFARPYFRYVAADGTTSKPFSLPMADPTQLDRSFYTYNLPELVTGPVTVSEDALTQAAGPVAPGRDQAESGQSP